MFEVVVWYELFVFVVDELVFILSVVSYWINQLEEELGIQFFVCLYCKVELMCEGKCVYWVLKVLLDGFNQEILDIKNQEFFGSLMVYLWFFIVQCWLVLVLGDFSCCYLVILLIVLIGNDNVNLQWVGIDLVIYFDDVLLLQLSYYFLMDEVIVLVCMLYYVCQLQLMLNFVSLCYCMLFYDCQVWSNDFGIDEWFSWV